MTLRFPSLAVLRHALASGVIPAKVAVSPVMADGLTLDFSFRSNKSFRELLIELGVEILEEFSGGTSHPHWLSLLPLEPSAIAADATILFEVPKTEMTPLVTELLRLGCDRISTAVLGDRVLLKAIAPPAYTLLRALETDSPLAAFTEAMRNVWVTAGFTHPLATMLVTDGLTLVDRTGWRSLGDVAFQDVYEQITFELPTPTPITASPLDPIRVPLTLVPANAEEARLWVLDRDAFATVQQFVRESDSRVLEPLEFAAAGDTIVLRSKAGTPPVLVLPHQQAYVRTARLSNLYLPQGYRLSPPVRRDILVRTLADDPDVVVWLKPDGSSFAPIRLDDAAFQPLSEWVEYVIAREAETLHAWMNAMTFEFESMTVADAPLKSREPKEKTRAESKESVSVPAVPASVARVVEMPTAIEALAMPVAATPSDWQIRCDAVEKEFLAIDGPLDHADRQRLWPVLATANTAMGEQRQHEALLCSLNAAWTQPAAEWPGIEGDEEQLPVRAVWLNAVKNAERTNDPLGLARVRDRLLLRLLERGLDPALDLPAFLRFAGVRDSEQARLVRERLPQVQQAVKDFTTRSISDPERTLAVIDLLFAWGWAHLGEITQAQGLLEQHRHFLVNNHGKDDHSLRLSLSGALIYSGFKQRIDNAIAARKHGGPLNDDIFRSIDEYRNNNSNAGVTTPHGSALYAVEMLMQHSWIYEPYENLNADRAFKTHQNPLAARTYALSLERNPEVLKRKIRDELRILLGEERVEFLHDVATFAFRAGVDVAREVVEAVPGSILLARAIKSNSSGFEEKKSRTLARAFKLAEFLELPTDAIIDQSTHLLRSLTSDEFYKSVVLLADVNDRDELKKLLDVNGDSSYDSILARLSIGYGYDEARSKILQPGLLASPQLSKLVRMYLKSLRFQSIDMATSRIFDLFERLDPWRILNRYAAQHHYSLFHVQFAEEAVRSLAGDDSHAGRESRRWLDEDELLIRRRIHADVARLVH